MIQTIELTHEEKTKIYKKLKKKVLIDMLIAANNLLEEEGCTDPRHIDIYPPYIVTCTGDLVDNDNRTKI